MRGVLAVAALSLALSTGGTTVGDPGPEPATGAAPTDAGVPWTQLSFVARKFLLTARATLSARAIPGAETVDILLEPPLGTATPLRGPVLIETRVVSDLPFGRGEETVAWILPGGTALQSLKRGVGRKLYQRQRRYTLEGYYSWRSEPADTLEKGLGPELWSRRDEELVAATPAADTSLQLTSSYALLYLISAARLDRPDSRLRLDVITNRERLGVEFAAGPSTRLEVDFEQVQGGSSTRRREAITVREVFGTPIGDDEDVTMGLMGMRGPLRVFLEEGTGMPVEVRGRAEHLGEIRVRLERVALCPEPTYSVSSAGGSGA